MNDEIIDVFRRVLNDWTNLDSEKIEEIIDEVRFEYDNE